MPRVCLMPWIRKERQNHPLHSPESFNQKLFYKTVLRTFPGVGRRVVPDDRQHMANRFEGAIQRGNPSLLHVRGC